MLAWRISDFADLSGVGGLLYSGRWHTEGRRIVYCADHVASALLEIIAHTAVDDMPKSLQLLTIDLGNTDTFAPVLPNNWQRDIELTRRIGDDWILSGRAAIARVPSVIVPHAWHFLLNPDHTDSSNAIITSVDRFELDPRLI